MAGTPLSEVYDAFFIKSGQDYYSKEDLVFQFFKTGISKSYKIISQDLTYTVDEDFNGEFTEILNQDAIELIALNMAFEEKRRKKSELDYTKQRMGTKDFSKLPNKVEEYKVISQSMKDLKEEIKDFEQSFKSYQN
jgi:hypothetical protein